MILLHVLASSKEEADLISSYLLDTGYIQQTTTIKRSTIKKRSPLNNIFEQERWLITCKAKASQYHNIKQKLFELFEHAIIDMYACPIVDMDWSEAHRRPEHLVA